MKNRDLENKLHQEFTADAPKALSDDVFKACDANKATPASTRKPVISLYRVMAAVAAVLVLVMVGTTALFLHNGTNTDQLPVIVPQTNHITASSPSANHLVSTVMLDVNPSVNIQLNADEEVLSVTPLNEDGMIIVGDMTFDGKTLDETVDMLIDSMIQNGYLSELANSVLVSVDSGNADEATRLQEKIAAKIEAYLAAGEFDGAVLSQTVSVDEATKTKAEANHISYGKAVLIDRILALDPLKTFDELAALPINDLNHIITTLSAQSTEATDLKTSGTASDKAYIGKDAALQAALAYLNITADSITNAEAELDYENGVMCYEIELVYNGTEYEFDIDATTGAVVEVEEEAAEDDDDDDRDDIDDDRDDDRDDVDDDDRNDHDDDDDRDEPDDEEDDALEDEFQAAVDNGSDAYITKDAAKAAVLAHAGIDEATVTDYDCEADAERGQAVFEIEFKSGDSEYDYTVDAVTGNILDHKVEIDD